MWTLIQHSSTSPHELYYLLLCVCITAPMEIESWFVSSRTIWFAISTWSDLRSLSYAV